MGEIINLKITSGSVHDVAVLESLTPELKGILLGDKGYLSKAKTEALAARGLRLLTPSRKNMKNKPIQTEEEKQLLCRRGLIETVNDQLKNFSVHDKFHRTLILSGFCLLKIAKISLNSSFFPKPIKR